MSSPNSCRISLRVLYVFVSNLYSLWIFGRYFACCSLMHWLNTWLYLKKNILTWCRRRKNTLVFSTSRDKWLLVSLWASAFIPMKTKMHQSLSPIQTPKMRYSRNKEVHMNEKEQCNSLKKHCLLVLSFISLLLFFFCCSYNILLITHHFSKYCKQCLRARKVFLLWCKQSVKLAKGGTVGNKVAIRMSVSWKEGEGGMARGKK